MGLWWIALIMTAWGGEPFTVWNYVEYPKWQKLLFDFERESGFKPTPAPVWSPSCDIAGEKRLGQIELTGSPKVPRGMAKALDFSLDAPSPYIKNYFRLYQRTPLGKKITERFRPLYESGKVPVLYFSQEKKARAPGAVAMCECEPGKKRIYVNKFAEAGLMAPSLAHEIVHALDPELHRAKLQRVQMARDLFRRFRGILEEASRRANRRVERLFLSDVSAPQLKPLFELRHQIDQFVQIAHYRAERRAGFFEDHLIGELRLSFPKYYSKFVKGSAPSSKEILKFYGFKADYVANYLSGNCQVPRGF